MSDFDRRQEYANKMKAKRAEKPKPQCRQSTVQPEANLIFNSIAHAGTIAHICILEENHTDSTCQCQCGYTWAKWLSK